jgi:hypothetical protein
MESDHGQSTAPGVHSAANFAGAEGPMQFEPGTFTAFAVHADRSRSLSPYDPKDAIFTAARMLCEEGARGGSPGGITSALFAYNHADWYPPEVMSWAAKYATSGVAHRVLVTRITRIGHSRVVGGRLRPHRATAPHAPAAPHMVAAPHAAAAPHAVAKPQVPRALEARRHATVAPTPEPTQSANPLAPIPAPTPPTPSASLPVPTPSAAQPSAAQPSAAQPSAAQPSAPSSGAQTAAPQVSADAQQLATESQQLSAEAEQLSDEAQQLAEEAQQLSAENGPAQAVPAPAAPAQAVPASSTSAGPEQDSAAP